MVRLDLFVASSSNIFPINNQVMVYADDLSCQSNNRNFSSVSDLDSEIEVRNFGFMKSQMKY